MRSQVAFTKVLTVQYRNGPELRGPGLSRASMKLSLKVQKVSYYRHRYSAHSALRPALSPSSSTESTRSSTPWSFNALGSAKKFKEALPAEARTRTTVKTNHQCFPLLQEPLQKDILHDSECVVRTDKGRMTYTRMNVARLTLAESAQKKCS